MLVVIGPTMAPDCSEPIRRQRKTHRSAGGKEGEDDDEMEEEVDAMDAMEQLFLICLTYHHLPENLCWAAAVPILLIAAAVIAVLAIRATLYNPTSPEFSVAAIQARNLDQPVKDHRHRPEFDVTLRAGYPNPRLSVSYKEGGEASLVFKNQKIGQGQILSTVEQPPNGGSVDFPVVLYGNGPPPLSPEIKKSLIDGATEKSMVVTIEVPMEINSWVRNERKDIKISCNFRVKNSLMNKTKISSQECRTEF
ncbi:hypothetical protein DH2020_015339 [Rehmannia glutinosa]|uniref:Late embryogenesis abundant protein LEA-2 subgroup domain-containing protein n=1 Tax=Rehmannia glutinosa TaxID=99300 RepID=A0ABR0WSC3_REHGL